MKNKAIILVYLSPLFATLLSLSVGSYKVDLSQLLREVFLTNPSEEVKGSLLVLLEVRLPRIILAFFVGAILSTSGTILQGLFRNPLVDPFILGISSGAAFGCALSFGYLSQFPVWILAFFFGLLAVILSYNLAKTSGEVNRLSLVLAGIIVSAIFNALIALVKFLVDPHRLQGIVFWIMGSLSLADWSKVKSVGFAFIVSATILFLMRWRLNILSLGEQEAKILGIAVERERLIFISFSSFMVAVATSAVGIIGWVGLLVPHILRLGFGADHLRLLPLSIFGGGTFLILADTLARTLASNYDLPISILTTLLGAPFLLYLLRKGKKEVWSS